MPQSTQFRPNFSLSDYARSSSMCCDSASLDYRHLHFSSKLDVHALQLQMHAFNFCAADGCTLKKLRSRYSGHQRDRWHCSCQLRLVSFPMQATWGFDCLDKTSGVAYFTRVLRIKQSIRTGTHDFVVSTPQAQLREDHNHVRCRVRHVIRCDRI